MLVSRSGYCWPARNRPRACATHVRGDGYYDVHGLKKKKNNLFSIGHHHELCRHVHVYRRGRYSTPLLDRLSERKQIHQRDFRTGHRRHRGRVVRAFRSRLPGGHRTVVHTFREGNGVRLIWIYV